VDKVITFLLSFSDFLSFFEAPSGDFDCVESRSRFLSLFLSEPSPDFDGVESRSRFLSLLLSASS